MAAAADAAASELVRLENVSHHLGRGAAARQVLYEVSLSIQQGEVAILSGPSGSGKTTALTLIGALRRVQAGSLRVLGEELSGASSAARVAVRRRIGFVFQQHNLLGSLTALQNVEMGFPGSPRPAARERRRRAEAMLAAVGLAGFERAKPERLSGGQRQRVAIARALVGEPRLILADEPTASLDRKSGREVVEILRGLARERGASVVLVTHDARILDVADRILHLEDGRLVSFGDAVLASTRHLMGLFAEMTRRGELAERVRSMHAEEFAAALERVTREAEHFLRVSSLAQSDAFEGLLDGMLVAFTHKIGDLLGVDRASLFLLDEATGELWSKAARDAGGELFEIRVPRGAGIAGAVALSGEPVSLVDAYTDPRFDPSADRASGYRTKSVLCVPIHDLEGRVFAVAQALNKRSGEPFDAADLRRFQEWMAALGVLLESWWRMSGRGKRGGAG
jgi:putative ABC transport system ATP-binding protein